MVITAIVKREVVNPYGGDKYIAASEKDVRKSMRKREKIEDLLIDIKANL